LEEGLFTGPTGHANPRPHSRGVRGEDRPSLGEAPPTSKEQHLDRNAPKPTMWLPPFNFNLQSARVGTAELTVPLQTSTEQGHVLLCLGRLYLQTVFPRSLIQKDLTIPEIC